MAKTSHPTDAVIVITPEQRAEHDRRQKVAEQRDKKMKDPTDAAKPAEHPTTEPIAATDTATTVGRAATAQKKKHR